MQRKKTKKIKIGNVFIGGGKPILIQSMLDRPFDDIQANVEQAQELEKAGCQMLRVAVPNSRAVELINILKRCISIPVIADMQIFVHKKIFP